MQARSLCPLKKDSHTCPGTITDLASPSHRAHSRGISALAVALLTVHSSCPLKRHIESRLGNSTGIADPFTVPTQEGHLHSSWQHFCCHKSLSLCPLKRHISTLVALLTVQSSGPLKRHISTRRCTTNDAIIIPHSRGTYEGCRGNSTDIAGPFNVPTQEGN